MTRQTICLYCNAWNESENIVCWLESGINAGCTHVSVLDTGGIDDTLAIVREWCRQRNIPCTTRYTDMNANPSGPDRRRAALDLARTLDTDYLFWLDADDRLTGTLPRALTEPAYQVLVSLDQWTWTRPHLIRRDTVVDWGMMPRHEAAALNPPARLTLSGLTVVEGAHRAKMRGGYLTDGAALDDYLRERPEDTRAMFYAARSYTDAGETFKAIDRYKSRIRIGGGFPDEVFYSWYMLGLLSTGTGECLVDLQMAVNLQPWRLEPYWALVDLCRNRGWTHLAKVWCEAGVKALADERSKVGLFVDTEAREALTSAWRELFERAGA